MSNPDDDNNNDASLAVKQPSIEKLMEGVCKKCQQHLMGNNNNKGVVNTKNDNDFVCTVSLGLFQENLKEIILKKLEDACLEYGGIQNNFFANQNPIQIIVPGDIVLRYEAIRYAFQKEYGQISSSSSTVFQQNLKQHLRTILMDHIKYCQQQKEGEEESRNNNQRKEEYPDFIHKEEQGYLVIQLLVMPKRGISRPNAFRRMKNNKRKRSSRNNKRYNNKKENQETSGGGDALVNLQEKLLQNVEEYDEFWSISEIVRSLENNTTNREALINWITNLSSESSESSLSSSVECHVVVHRKSIYVKSMYTKSRRDVSQTPFDVTDEDGKLKRLGTTSVEEQILPHLKNVMGGTNGKIKFHASGREDMNVRMMLPPRNTLSDGTVVGGRPFVCQAIDVFKLPSTKELKVVVENVNHIATTTTTTPSHMMGIEDRLYGKNPMGVGIYDELTFCPAKDFSTLQADAESKVKYYGCLCWSKDILTMEQMKKLSTISFPLLLQQKTPIRVLHRRNNMIRERQILSLSYERIDDHYFQLHLSTSAGTYVKEFVHGDMGRTQPNIATILNTQTDILQLDCEGIQLS